VEILGDLKRAFATTLYPLRIPLMALAAAAFVAVLWFARRRGWLAAVRRHPARTGVAAVVVLAVTLPAAWYLASPLVVRSELQEAPPVAVIVTAAPAAAPTSPRPAASPEASTTDDRAAPGPSSSPPVSAPSPPARAGMFTGADDFHFGRGVATLIATEPGRYVLRFEDFSVRNGPDLYVYLSPDPAGYTDGAIELGRLRATDGSFNTPIPVGTDVSSTKSVVIFCKEFAVTFAVAPLDG